MNDKKEIKNMEKMNKEQMLELLRTVEIIEKKNIDEIIKDYYLNLENYLSIENELIENKINLIKSKNNKYISVESYENIKIYTYNNEIQIYHKTKINIEKIKEKIKNTKTDNIYIKEKNKTRKISIEDIERMNKDFEIIIKTK
jgi:hypothetical protein